MLLRDEVARDMRKSTPDFLHVIWPALQQHCPELKSGHIRIVEGGESEIRADLDIRAGIDAYQRWDCAMRGIACRVQWGKNYRSFTIRTARPSGKETEYQKRLAVLKRRDEGFLYPYWTVQGYLDSPGGALLSVAVAKTAELYLWIEHHEKHVCPLPRKKATKGGEGFLYVDWDLYRSSGNYLFEYPALAQRINHLIASLEEIGESEDNLDEEEMYLSEEDPGMQQAEEILTRRQLNDWIDWLEEYKL